VPTLSFEGETHDEIVRKVRRWLASLEGHDEHLDLPEAVERASELTKDALAVVAAVAPAPIARSDITRALTRMGYDLTDSTKRAVIAGLDALSDATEGDVVQRIERARNSVLYEMNAAVAKQILRALR
jgi:hypothetical protein